MRRHVDILIAISEKHLQYSLFVKRIIAIEAQLYFWAWSDYSDLLTVTKATITRCDLSATILFKFVDSYLIAFKFAQ